MIIAAVCVFLENLLENFQYLLEKNSGVLLL